MYSRAVWREGKGEQECTIPSHWIRQKEVLWPKGIDASKALSSMQEPAKNWRVFTLVKVKISSGTCVYLICSSSRCFCLIDILIHCGPYVKNWLLMFLLVLHTSCTCTCISPMMRNSFAEILVPLNRYMGQSDFGF